MVRVAVLAAPHPRRRDPALEGWARRQTLAARAAGAEVHVLAPQRPQALWLRAWRRRVGFDLIHAHGVPAAIAVRQARLSVPMVLSVYGRDLFDAPSSRHDRTQPLAAALRAARLTLTASEGAAALARLHGASDVSVVHLGVELPRGRSPQAPSLSLRADEAALGQAVQDRTGPPMARKDGPPRLVTVGRLIARKRHADVLRALAVLSQRHPGLRYLIVGDGPERVSLEGLSHRLGVAERVEIVGQLPASDALARARACTIFAMPSIDEAFGIAYLEAMAGGLPAIGCRGEPGPEQIAAAGDGFLLVPPGDVERLSQRIDELLSDPQRLREAAMHARETVAAHFTWERCGQGTLAAYEHALRPGART